MILGICGLKNSGKDTAANYLVENYNFEKRSYAAPLKKASSVLLDIPLHELEKFKNDDTVFVSTGYKNHPKPEYPGCGHGENGDPIVPECPLCAIWLNTPDYMWSPIRELVFREFWQRFGTEMGRNIFGEDFWVKQCLPHGNYVGKNIVIADVRFPNEVERIHNLGGKVIYIVRPNQLVEDMHASEFPGILDYDYAITNNASIEYLHAAVETALEALLV